MGLKQNLIGNIYGRLKVTSESDNCKNRTMWFCECTCGNTCVVRADHLKSNITSSCGCLRLDRLKDSICTHKATGTDTYNIWESMNQRCNNPKSNGYSEYGGRGIKICYRWSGRVGFENFLSDMGERPKCLSLDRIDVNGNYEPSNCRWADSSLQSFNTRKPKNNTSGRSGVSWDKHRSKWASYIMKDYKKISLGRFETFEEAVHAREQAELKYFGFNKE